MPAYTFFYDGPLASGTTIELDPEQSHHLARVMRLREGEEALIINGQGVEFSAQVANASGFHSLCRLNHCTRERPPSSCPLTIIQGITALNKLDWIVEKLTELGIDHLLFFSAERSSRERLSEHQLAKLRQRSIAACKQSGRLTLPTLHSLDSLKQLSCYPQWLPPQSLLFSLDPTADRTRGFEADRPLAAVVGPESGLTPGELKLLEQLGAESLCIHNHVLRSETASIACAVQMAQTRGV